MNGRLYDPLSAQFLSADKYIQAPYFTQGFNRYVYCYNNPLKYKDPTGWYAISDISLVENNGGGRSYNRNIDFDLYGKAIYDIGLTSGSSSSSGNYTFSWDNVWYLYFFTPFGGEWSTTSGLRVFKSENLQNRAAQAYNRTWELDPSIIPQVTSPDASDSRLLAYTGSLPLDYIEAFSTGGQFFSNETEAWEFMIDRTLAGNGVENFCLFLENGILVFPTEGFDYTGKTYLRNRINHSEVAYYNINWKNGKIFCGEKWQNYYAALHTHNGSLCKILFLKIKIPIIRI